jgi:hypothetical protein
MGVQTLGAPKEDRVVDGNELTKRELEHFPRGKPGSERNIFRAVLWMAFRNFYSGRRDPGFTTRQSVYDFCVAFMRQQNQGFDPGSLA